MEKVVKQRLYCNTKSSAFAMLFGYLVTGIFKTLSRELTWAGECGRKYIKIKITIL